jgi:hypothetical protein
MTSALTSSARALRAAGSAAKMVHHDGAGVAGWPVPA